MAQIKKVSICFSVVLYLLLSVYCFADEAPLEVAPDGNVKVNTKLSLKSVLHIDPSSAPPANPVEGDIYFTATKELLLYANGKWTPIVSASATHGFAHLTSGSGTWTVPAGIYSITVTLVSGGGGGGYGYYSGSKDNTTCNPGRNGGSGGYHGGVYINVVPGQQFSYSVGSGGSGGARNIGDEYSSYFFESTNGTATSFGNLNTTGGQGGSPTVAGSNGSPSGTYPYGSFGAGGIGATSCNGVYGGSGGSGAIYVQY